MLSCLGWNDLTWQYWQFHVNPKNVDPPKTTTKNISSACILNWCTEWWHMKTDLGLSPQGLWTMFLAPWKRNDPFFLSYIHSLGLCLGFCIHYSLIPYKAIRSINALKSTPQYIIWHFAHDLGTYNGSAFCQGCGHVCQESRSPPLLDWRNNTQMKNSNQLWKQADSLAWGEISHIICSEIQTYATRLENNGDHTPRNSTISFPDRDDHTPASFF